MAQKYDHDRYGSTGEMVEAGMTIRADTQGWTIMKGFAAEDKRPRYSKRKELNGVDMIRKMGKTDFSSCAQYGIVGGN